MKEGIRLTDRDLLDIAMRQSAIDSGCDAADFAAAENKVVVSRAHPDARRYLSLPFDCDLTTYGGGIVASVSPEHEGLDKKVAQYIETYPSEHCFETPNMHVLSEILQPYGLDICFMAEYFLPETDALRCSECGFELRTLTAEDFPPLYTEQWSNALCAERKHLDVLAVGAYDGDTLVGLAGCSADCGDMWQIGVDVLPQYRRRGIASVLTGSLALEILRRDKVPFYCCAWSNLASVRNAMRSGFRPAWVSLTAKKKEFVADINRRD